MWSKTAATTAAVIALIAASCGGEAGVDTTGTVPETPDVAAGKGIESDSVETDIPIESEPMPTVSPSDVSPRAETAPEPDPDPRWPTMLADARESMIAGQCERAIELFDELLADEAWNASSSSVEQVRSEREGCADLLAVRTQTSGAADTITAYLRFLDRHPDTPLDTIVVAEIRRLYQTAGADAFDVDSCDAIDDEFEILGPSPTTAMAACAAAYRSAGRTGDAAAIAADLLPIADDQSAVDLAVEILASDRPTCTGLANGVRVVDPAERPGRHAALLRSCMTAAADDPEQLAMLQVTFLIDLPRHRAAPTVEAALIENVAACDHIEWMQEQPAFSDRRDLILTKTFECAQFASFVGDVDTAIERFETFLEMAPDDSRAAAAQAGLAGNLIAEAKEGVTNEIDRPHRSGSTGGGHTRLLFSNDTAYDQHIVVVGPESRIVTTPASPDSSTYAQRPTSCRTDVPSVTIDLQPGTYEVMVYDDVAAPEIGTWTLESGAEYGWCAFYVRA